MTFNKVVLAGILFGSISGWAQAEKELEKGKKIDPGYRTSRPSETDIRGGSSGGNDPDYRLEKNKNQKGAHGINQRKKKTETSNSGRGTEEGTLHE